MVDGVFHENLIRHAFEETMDRWFEMNIRPDAKDTLFCVTKAMIAKLGQPQMMKYLGGLIETNRPILKRIKNEEKRKTPQEPLEQWQPRERLVKEARERIWTSLGTEVQAEIKEQRNETAPKATDEDLKAASYELVSELFERTSGWARR